MSKGRSKRLYRVTAYDINSQVIYRRDYQSRGAAETRVWRLRDRSDEVASVTITESDVITWPAEDRGAP